MSDTKFFLTDAIVSIRCKEHFGYEFPTVPVTEE